MKLIRVESCIRFDEGIRYQECPHSFPSPSVKQPNRWVCENSRPINMKVPDEGIPPDCPLEDGLQHWVETDAEHGSQLYNGKWYAPKWGCDTLAKMLEDE